MADDVGDAGLTRKVPRKGPQCPKCLRPNAVHVDLNTWQCWCCRQTFEAAPEPPPAATAAPEPDDDLTPHWMAFGGWEPDL